MHEQDPRKTARLEAAGFYVVRLWEHEVVHDSERVGVILVLLRGQKWRAFQRVLDELDRAEEAAIERGRPKLLGRLLQRAKQESARQGKPLHPDIVAFYRSEMSEWSLRNPEGDLRRRPRQDARAAFGL